MDSTSLSSHTTRISFLCRACLICLEFSFLLSVLLSDYSLEIISTSPSGLYVYISSRISICISGWSTVETATGLFLYFKLFSYLGLAVAFRSVDRMSFSWEIAKRIPLMTIGKPPFLIRKQTVI